MQLSDLKIGGGVKQLRPHPQLKLLIKKECINVDKNWQRLHKLLREFAARW